MDNDCLFTSPADLENIAAAMAKDEQIGVLSFEVVRPDGHLLWPFSRPASVWRKQVFETIRLDGGACAIRAKAFRAAGGFAEHFAPYGAEDQHFALRLIGNHFKAMYFPIVSMIHAFSPRGRLGSQMSYHTRNMLWIPLENFPFPHNIARACKASMLLCRDAMAERSMAYFWKGVRMAVTGLHPSRFRPMPNDEWSRFLKLIRQEKMIATDHESDNKNDIH
jgi:GT2 family glycosyltransferase